MRSGLQAMLQESDLPEGEQDEMLRQFDRVADAYTEGEISLQELAPVMQELVESPVMVLVMLKAVEAKYVDPSGLSAEEKEQAHRTMVRVLRGVIEEKLSKEDIERVTKHFLENPEADTQKGEQFRLKPNLSDDELRALLAEALEVVDEREVPDDPNYEVKLSDVVRDIVDKALNK